jgi:hypothetical protein
MRPEARLSFGAPNHFEIADESQDKSEDCLLLVQTKKIAQTMVN